MHKAALHGVEGVGELNVTHTPEGTMVKGLWYSIGSEELDKILEAQEEEQVVAYRAHIYNVQYPVHFAYEVKLKIRSVEIAVNPETGDVQLTASVYALFPAYKGV